MKRRSFLFGSLLAIPNSIRDFFQDKKRGVIVLAGKDRFDTPVKLGPNLSHVKVSSEDTHGALAIFENIGNQSGPPLHMHPNQDEIFHILGGRVLFQVGQDRMELQTGDTLFAPRGVPHAFLKIGDTPARMYITYQPAGKIEAFYKRVSEFQQLPSEAEFKKVFEDHDMKMVGPRLTP